MKVEAITPYLTKSQFTYFVDYVADSDRHVAASSRIGKSILKYPEILAKLDDDFFLEKGRGFKYIFSDTPAEKLLTIEDRLTRFTGWDKFFKTKKKNLNVKLKKAEATSLQETETILPPV